MLIWHTNNGTISLMVPNTTSFKTLGLRTEVPSKSIQILHMYYILHMIHITSTQMEIGSEDKTIESCKNGKIK